MLITQNLLPSYTYTDASGNHIFVEMTDVLALSDQMLLDNKDLTAGISPDVRNQMELLKSILDAANNSKLPFAMSYKSASGSANLCLTKLFAQSR